ncbi:hypothetical protein JHN59_30850 [Streptomyces sp. MBT49]|uniref:hypothetical protein n=1 Tax=Streptomyces sp. MBT49 TaxID=1488380 RepID=UPI00190A20FD|nr:hypothetical protein [Streptomyces sp. MBT49]MBK3629142.1 hypothetical protein [Streptomyces sp. MBT49]
MCHQCALEDALTIYFDKLPHTTAEQLQPLRDALASNDHPQTGLVWLRKTSSARLLADAAESGTLISHETVDGFAVAGRHEAAAYLRHLLVSAGVLPDRDEHLAHVERHLAKITNQDPENALVLRAYCRWRVLPRLRRRARQRPPTDYITSWATRRISSAAAFLAWARRQGMPLKQVTQEAVDLWLSEGKSSRYNVRDFLVWTSHRGYSRHLLVPHRGKPDPAGMDDDQHWDTLQQCLHDHDLPLQVRVAGSLVLFYGQQVSRIAALNSSHLQTSGDRTYLVLDHVPVLLMPPLARLIKDLEARQPPHPIRSSAEAPRWLFPGQQPGQHSAPASIVRSLNQAGIHVNAGRTTALMNLAQDLPAAVLASLTGMHVVTAEQWHRRAAPDWSAYLAARRKAGHAPSDASLTVQTE